MSAKKKENKDSIFTSEFGRARIIEHYDRLLSKVDKLVLLAASGIASLRVCWIFRLILFSLQGEKGAEKITQMVYGNDPIPQEVKDYLSLISENYRPYTGAIPVFPDAELRRLEMPILYIGGENDRLTNAPKCEMRLRKVLPHTDIVLLKNRGHVIYNVLDRVMPFLCG